MSRLYDVALKDHVIPIEETVEKAQGESPKTAVGKNPHEEPVRQVTGFRTIGLQLPQNSAFFPFAEAQHLAAEQYRMARTKLLHHPKEPRVMVVSSACTGDGKTVTAVNLAATFGLKSDSAVLLMDADLRRPRVSEALGIPITPGLADVIAGRSTIESAILCAEPWRNLYVMPAGAPVANPAELLDSDSFRVLVRQLRSQFPYLVLDAPPVGAVADYELLQAVSDGTIVVLRPDHTDKAASAHLLKTVPKEKLLGIILNCVEHWCFSKTPTYGYNQAYTPEQIVKERAKKQVPAVPTMSQS